MPAVAALTALALLAEPQVRAETVLKPGIFLYAAPGSTDPFFAETVVLLVYHDARGSSGLVVNRPTRMRLGEELSGPEELQRLRLPLHWGGPVQPARVLALVRSTQRPKGALRILPGLDFFRDLDHMTAEGRTWDATSVRLYSGRAGWSPGQLEAEMRRGDWVLGPADAAAVFTPEPLLLWPRVHHLVPRVEVRSIP